MTDYMQSEQNALTMKDWSVDESSNKATVNIEYHANATYSIRYTTDLSWSGVTTGKSLKFAISADGAEDQDRIGIFSDDDFDVHTRQVWFTLPDVKQDYYIGIAVNGVICTWEKIVSATTSYTITWCDADGNEIDKTTVAEGETPVHEDPTKTASAPYIYGFTGWTPTIAAATADATYTATFAKVADLASLTTDWTAADGDIITNTTVHAVTVPAGASVTVNGVNIRGAAGAPALPAPVFAEGGKSATTAFTQGENGIWTLTAFAEIDNDAIGADVADGQIKVYSAETFEKLANAQPMPYGVTIKEKKSAVKTTVEVEAPADAKSRFFKVEFGK